MVQRESDPFSHLIETDKTMAKKKFTPPAKGFFESDAAHQRRVTKAEKNFNKTQKAAEAAHAKHGPLLGGGNLGGSGPRSTKVIVRKTCGTCGGNKKITSGDGKSSFTCPGCSGAGFQLKEERR